MMTTMIDDPCRPITDYLLTARRKSTEWSALEKPLRRYRVRRLPEIRFLELAKGFEPLTL